MDLVDGEAGHEADPVEAAGLIMGLHHASRDAGHDGHLIVTCGQIGDEIATGAVRGGTEGEIVTVAERTVETGIGDRDIDGGDPRLSSVSRPAPVEVPPHLVTDRGRAVEPEVGGQVGLPVAQDDDGRSIAAAVLIVCGWCRSREATDDRAAVLPRWHVVERVAAVEPRSTPGTARRHRRRAHRPRPAT